MTQQGTTARSDLSQMWFTLISLLSVGCAFGLSWAGLTLVCLILCLAGMGALAWFCYARCAAERDGDSLHEYTERIYLLGYLLTISAIAGVVLQIGGADTAGLLRTGGVKLVTTISGLMVMFWFKERAHSWERERKRSVEEEDGVLGGQLRQAIRGLNGDADELRTKFSAVIGTFDPAALSTMAVAANEMARLVRETAGAFPGLKGAADQLSSQLSNVETQSRRLQTGVQALGTALEDTRKANLTPAAEALSALAAGAGGAATGLSAVREQAGQFGKGLQALAQHTATDQKALTEVREGLVRLTEAFASMETGLKKNIELYRTDADAPLRKVVTALENTARIIVEQGGRYNELSVRLATLNGQLEKLSVRGEPRDGEQPGRFFGIFGRGRS